MSSQNDASPWRLEWTEELSVFIPEIDAEHQHFILLVNQLNDAIVRRMDLEEINKRMQSILDDAIAHFAHEEALFKEWCYPEAGAHKKIHVQILVTLQEIMEGFSRSGLEYVLIEAGLIVKDALLKHILVEDMKYRDFRRQQVIFPN